MPGTAHVLHSEMDLEMDGSEGCNQKRHHFERILRDPLNGLDLENIPNQEQACNDGVFTHFAMGNPGVTRDCRDSIHQFSDPKQSCSPSCRIMHKGHDLHCIPTK